MEYINGYIMDIYFVCNTIVGGMYYGDEGTFTF